MPAPTNWYELPAGRIDVYPYDILHRLRPRHIPVRVHLQFSFSRKACPCIERKPAPIRRWWLQPLLYADIFSTYSNVIIKKRPPDLAGSLAKTNCYMKNFLVAYL